MCYQPLGISYCSQRNRLHPCHFGLKNSASLKRLAWTRSSVSSIVLGRAVGRLLTCCSSATHPGFGVGGGAACRSGPVTGWTRATLFRMPCTGHSRSWKDSGRCTLRRWRSYLRRTIQNRIGDQLRHATLRGRLAMPNESIQLSDEAAPQYQQFRDNETWSRYMKGLEQLTPRHQRLIVGRLELGYSYRQMALIERLSTPDAARMAFQRALVRLSSIMPDG